MIDKIKDFLVTNNTTTYMPPIVGSGVGLTLTHVSIIVSIIAAFVGVVLGVISFFLKRKLTKEQQRLTLEQLKLTQIERLKLEAELNALKKGK